MWKLSCKALSCVCGLTIISLSLLSKYECLELTTVVPGDQIPANPPSNKYSALVVFGDSYSDDGHTRPVEYLRSLSSPPGYGGRFCDGYVWDEYLAQSLSVESNIKFLNYAYNGAHINNKLSNLTYSLPPDTATQIQTYFTDLQQYVQQSVSTKVFDARILHTLWIGINPLITTWKTWLNESQITNTHVSLEARRARRLDQQVGELRNQLTQLLNNQELSKFDADYVLLTIPPLVNTKLVRDTALGAAGGKSNLAQKYVKLFSDMTDYFNLKLIEKVNQTRENLLNSAHMSRVSVFDTAEIWHEVELNPSMFGIDSLDSCYPDVNKTRCTPPNRFMYWDVLHPSSIMHVHISNAILTFLEGVDA